jgi:LuxR family quorum sensing-dependent transcriptional regulator
MAKMESKRLQGALPPTAAKTRMWRREFDQTYRVLDRIWRCRKLEEVSACVVQCFARFGVTHLLAGSIPPPGASKREQRSHVFLDAWPNEWACRYFSNGYLDRDPTIRLIRHGVPSFRWGDIDDLVKIDRVSRRVLDEAAEFSLRDGITISFATIERHPIGFSVSGDRIAFDPHERITLQFAAAVAAGQAIALVDGRQRRDLVHLSPRQLDVLCWASEGLSVEDIADRLNISRNTADSHLRMVRERLGVATTVHAVAEALRTGLIT